MSQVRYVFPFSNLFPYLWSFRLVTVNRISEVYRQHLFFWRPIVTTTVTFDYVDKTFRYRNSSQGGVE